MAHDGELPIRIVQGGWSVDFEPGTGWIRDIRWRGVEVVRALYLAVRDERWGTFPTRADGWTRRTDGAAQEIVWRGGAEGAGVDWEWRLRLTAGGGLSYAAEGRANADLRTMRTGLCVLHPPRHAGMPVTVHHPDGTSEAGRFPDEVMPTEPFFAIEGLLVKDPVAGDLRLTFGGEVFEMEDQRNWSDASFKTYCRPAAWPRPYPIAAGERLRHTLEVAVHRVDGPADAGVGGMIDLDALPSEPSIRPALGLGIDRRHPLESAAYERLAAIRPEFLWFEVAGPDDWADAVEAMGHLTGPIGAVLQAHARPAALDAPGEVLEAAFRAMPGGRVVVEFGGWSEADAARLVRAGKAAWATGVALVLSSRNQYTELNRVRPDFGAAEGVGFGVTPQVHAFDDRSILENAETVGTLVRNARDLAGGRPVHVGPVTLAGRDGAEDPRARTWLGAMYTLRLLAGAARAGAASVALFRLNGPDGLVGGARWNPVLDLLADLRRAPGWRIGEDPASGVQVLNAGRFGAYLTNPVPRAAAVWTEHPFTSTAAWRTGQPFESHPGQPVPVPPMDAAVLRFQG